MLISCAVTVQLICAFVFAYANRWFSHAKAHIFSFQYSGYYIYSLLSTISSFLGLLLLVIPVSKYFHSIVLDDGKMLHMFIICCFPCCGKKVSSLQLKNFSKDQIPKIWPTKSVSLFKCIIDYTGISEEKKTNLNGFQIYI